MSQSMASDRARGAIALLVMALCLAGPAALAQDTGKKAAGPGVSGWVLALDEKGLPAGMVPGAKIEFKGQGGQAAAQATADAHGYYKADLPPGTYSYKVTAPGFKDEDVGRGITLTKSEGYAVYNFSLVKGKNDPDKKPPIIPTVKVGKLQGRVLEKMADGKTLGIPGARITLRKNGGTKPVQVTSGGESGDQSGHYEIVLPTGTYRASVAAAGFETLVDPDPIAIVAAKDQTRDFVLKRVKPPEPVDQGIKGTITAYDAKGQAAPLPKVNVTIQPLGNSAVSGGPFSPDSQGKYARDLTPGAYQVIAQAPGYQTAQSGPKYVVQGKYTIVNLVLRPARPPKELTLVVTVYERLADRKDKQPLPGATVLLRKHGEPINGSPHGVTGDDGKVSLKVAAAGAYDLLARKAGYKPAGQAVTITAAGPNQAELILEKVREEKAALTAEVLERGPDGKTAPVPGARVLVRKTGQAPIAQGTSDAVGRYIAPDLPRATYQVEASKAGYQAATATADLTGGDAAVRLVLVGEAKPQAVLTVQMQEQDPDGRLIPARGARVVVSKAGQTVAEGTADASGLYRTRLPRDAYAVKGTKANRSAGATADLTGGDAEVQLVLDGAPPALGTLTVHVQQRDPDGRLNAVEGARVLVRRGDLSAAEGTTGAGGRYVTRLRPGSYRVEATKGDLKASAAADLTHGDAEVHVILEGKAPPALGTLTVHVQQRDPDGRLIAVGGAFVKVVTGDRVWASGETGTSGRYVTRLRPGVYLVEAGKGSQPGASARADLTHGDAEVHLIIGGETLAPTLTVHVQAREPDGKLVLLAGAQVIVRRGDQIAAQGTTGAAGRYVTRLRATTYQVEASKGSQKGSTTADLTHGDQAVRIVLGGGPDGRTATLTVQVQAKGAGGNPVAVAGARVAVRSGAQMVAQGTTDTAGRYTAANLARATYQVEASKGSQKGSTTADLTHGDQTVRVLLSGGASPTTATLTVQVQAKDPGGKLVAVAGARVAVRSGAQMVAQGTTDTAGRYTAANLARATYQVEASKGGQDGTAAANLTQGDQTVRVLLSGGTPPPSKATLTVQVQGRDPDGKLMLAAGARVMVRKGGQVVAQGVTDASGRYRASGLERAGYQVEATKGSQRGATAADLTRGDQTVTVLFGSSGSGGKPN